MASSLVSMFFFLPPPQDGRKECVMFDKITSRISKLCYGLNKDFIDPVSCGENEAWSDDHFSP